MRRSGLILLAALAFAPAVATAQSPAAAAAVDRVVVRWYAPETGGAARPRFVFARELAFEARLEALADPDADGAVHRERHVRAALDRHVAESLLASLPTLPAPKPAVGAARAELARGLLEQRGGGRGRLLEAARAEGISSDELDALLRRQARASLYLDRMIAPMLEPSEVELREVFESGGTPFSGGAFDRVAPALRRWYVARRLEQATQAHYQNARGRVTMVVVRGR
ncbi:MAG: hypothetical protein WKG00_27575 [Polyangiaceae bacterium]